MDQKDQFDKAVTALRSGDFQTASELCDQSLEQFPGDANFLCLSARTNIALKNFEAAERHIEDAMRLFPDFALAHETFGDLMLIRGNASGARAAYETASRLDPGQTQVRQKIDRAKAHEEVAKKRPPPQPPRMPFEDEIGKAREHEQSGDPRAAEMIYRDILKKDPNHVEAARLLAAIAAKQKRFRDADFPQTGADNAVPSGQHHI